jgi:hypothetical protein
MNIVKLDNIITSNRYFENNQTSKKRIILSDTFSNSIDNYLNYLKLIPTYRIPNFIIGKDGIIYELLDYKCYTLFIDDYSFHKEDKLQKIFNSESIIISLENNGYLSNNNNQFFNYLNQEVDKNNIIEKNFRGYIHWDKYTNEQVNSLFELLEYLSKLTGIMIKNPKYNSLLYDKYLDYCGLLFSSNINESYLSPNPSFPFSLLKERFSPLRKK